VLDVCSWHKACMLNALTNVCFEGKNGHDADVARCLFMTQSGSLEKTAKMRWAIKGAPRALHDQRQNENRRLKVWTTQPSELASFFGSLPARLGLGRLWSGPRAAHQRKLRPRLLLHVNRDELSFGLSDD
jgi:hypothetical protein